MATAQISDSEDMHTEGNAVDEAASAGTSEEASNSNNTLKNLIPWQQKLETAKEYKAAGNEFYKAKSYKAAMSKYHRAMLYIRGIDTAQESNNLMQNFGAAGDMSLELTPEGRLETNEIKRDCYNNLAACILHTADPAYSKVLQYCDNILELFPNNVKAMYRKGVALYHMQDPEQALQVLNKASGLPEGSKDGNIKKYSRLCEQTLSQQDQRMKDTYRAMFQNMTVDSSAEQGQSQQQNGTMDT